MQAGATALRVAGTLVVLLVILSLAAVLYLGVSARTPPVVDVDGRPAAQGIAVLERVEIGGMEQWILIRGADLSNPVLLWLHGGPGGAQMPFAHHTDRELERHFVVVHWDQRGAGKSNHGGFDEATMRLEQYLLDAVELIEYLRQRLGQERIVLLGHSWGTRLGMELAAAHPDYLHAYVGVSQVVDHGRATAIARDWLLETIDRDESPRDWRALREIEFPAFRHGDFRELNRLTTAYGGSLDLSMAQLARIVAGAPEYTLFDYRRLVRGMNRGGGPMHPGGIIAHYDLIDSIPSVEVPIFFLMGANDYNTPLELVEEYCGALEAPHKELMVFERSAHLPFLAENEQFVGELIGIRHRLAGATTE